ERRFLGRHDLAVVAPRRALATDLGDPALHLAGAGDVLIQCVLEARERLEERVVVRHRTSIRGPGQEGLLQGRLLSGHLRQLLVAATPLATVRASTSRPPWSSRRTPPRPPGARPRRRSCRASRTRGRAPVG